MGNQVYFEMKSAQKSNRQGVIIMLPKMQEAVNELKGFKESLDEIRVSL